MGLESAVSLRHCFTSLCFVLMLLASAGSSHSQEQPAAGQTVPGNGNAATPPVTQPEVGTPPPAVNGDTLTVAELEARKSAVESNLEIPQDQRDQIIDRYKQAIDRLKAAEGFRQRTAYYNAKLASAPEETETARKEAERLKNLPPVEPPTDVPADAALDRYGQLLSESQSRLATLQTDRQRFVDETKQERERLGQMAPELTDAQRVLEEIETELKGLDPTADKSETAEARRSLLRARKLARLGEIEKLRQEKLTYDVRIKWRDAELSLRDAKIAREQATVDVYRKKYDELSKIEAQKRLADARKELSLAAEDPVIKPVAEENIVLAKELKELSERRAKRAEQLSVLTRELDDIKRTFEQARSKLDTLGMSEVLGRTLQSQRQALTDTVRRLKDTGELSSRLEELLLRQFEIDDQLSQLQDVDAAAKELVDAQTDETAPNYQMRLDRVSRLLKARKQFLQTLDGDLTTNIGQINDVDSTRRQFEEQVEEFESFLDERLIWTPNAKPVNLKTPGDVWKGVLWLSNVSNWHPVGPEFWAAAKANVVTSFSLLVAFIGLLVMRRRMLSGLRVIAGRIGVIYADRFRSTLEAILLTALLALPGPLLIMGVGWILSHATDSFAASLGAGLLGGGRVWYLLSFIRGLSRPHGLGSIHFRWRDSGLSLVRRQLNWAMPVLVFGTIVIQMTRAYPDDVYLVGLGRVFFVVNLVVVATVTFRVFHPAGEAMRPMLTRSPGGWLNRLRWIWFPLGFGLPLVLAMLALAGYLYSGMHLRERLIATMGLIVFSAVLHATILRWQILTHSRLAIAKAREKRKQMEEAAREQSTGSATAEFSIDIPKVDLAAINENTRQLIRMIVGLGVIIGLWLIWADVIQAFTILDRVKIGNLTFSQLNSSGDAVDVPVTLTNVVGSVVMILVTTLAVMNLPSMVEAAILQRVNMEPGARYAWTTIFRYVLITIGIIVIAQSVGVNWSSLQWLVAALGVGLGFGLQEIFANFISGLIILFERPIRVGDTVTIGDITGTVTKIRMRATTIVDWDRKELIVPNREFITGQLINWSLSDLITRWIVHVGVAYGSDTAKAHDILLKVAHENDEVLPTPTPQAFFLGFGDNSLNFELRVFIDDISRRFYVMHELHMAIDAAFREAGITIAFPQRDVHLDSLSPVEVRLVNPPEASKQE